MHQHNAKQKTSNAEQRQRSDNKQRQQRWGNAPRKTSKAKQSKANKQTNEQASKTINQQDFHYEDQYFSSDLQRDLMRMQEFHKHAKSLQIQPKCIR